MNSIEEKLFRMAGNCQDEEEEENCVALINGRRFKYKSNTTVFDNPRKALNAIRSAIDRYFWGSRTRFSREDLEDWIKRYVVLVPPEEYFKAKRKMRNK